MPHLTLEGVPCCVCGGHSGVVALQGRDVEFLTCDNEFTFLACSGCGHLYLSPRPQLHDLPVIYRNYLTENRASAYYPSSFVSRVKDRFDAGRMRAVLAHLSHGSCVLDIGAGAGRLLQLLRRASGKDVALYANDLWFAPEVRADFARQEIGLLEGPIESVVTDLRFDAITAIHVIEHVADPRTMLQWIAAHLTDDGVAYLETPDAAAPARRIFGRHWGMTHFPRHFNLFSRQHLAQLAGEAELDVVRHAATTTAPAWNMSVRNLLGMDALSKRKGPLELFNYSNVGTLAAFTLLDLALIGLGFPTSTQQLILQRRRGRA
jgi:2-polyprenyl-3-methyl-5-hydroxy-6-metoxy-1,4-benzoquinol methylase